MRALLSSSDPSTSSATSTSASTPTSTGTEIQYKIAENQRERAAAFRLCHDAYVQAGLMTPQRAQMRITPYHLLPTSTIFIAVQGGQVVATVSLIGDGQLGLPMECAYRKEVAELRKPSRWLGEVSSLASRQRQPRCQLDLLGNLTRLLAQYAQRHGLEHLLAAVHPKHARFYQRFLGYQQLGSPKPYPAVRNRPSLAMLLDLPLLEQTGHSSYLAYFGALIPDEELRFCPISGTERRFFAAMLSNGRPPSVGDVYEESGDIANLPTRRASA